MDEMDPYEWNAEETEDDEMEIPFLRFYNEASPDLTEKDQD